MDTPNCPLDDNLSDVEKRLRAWQPAGTGLDADAMLYAAGKAEARGAVRGRAVWLMVACVLGISTAGFGSQLLVERAERQALAHEFRLRSGRPVPPVAPLPEVPRGGQTMPENGYLGVRNLVLEKGVEAWPVTNLPPDNPQDPPVPHLPVLQVGSRDGLLE
jgi:hypothetical protein